MKYFRSVLLSFLFLSAFPAWSGTYIRSAIQSSTDKNDWLYTTLTIDQGKLRADIQGPDLSALEKAAKDKSAPAAAAATETYTLLYDKATAGMILVIPSEKSAYEFTKTDMKELKALFSILSIELDRFMEDPQMMKENMLMGWEKAKRTMALSLTAASSPEAVQDRVLGHSCKKYAFHLDGKEWMDYWCLPAGRIPVPVKDFQTTQALTAAFLETFTDFLSLFNVTPKRVLQLPFFHDFLMKWTSYNKTGEPMETYRILEIRSKDCTADIFEIPPGYKKTDVHELVMKIPQKMEEKDVEGGMSPSETPEPEDP